MTKEEYKNIEPGDLVRLVDDIREIANKEGDDHVLKSIFVPGNNYIVEITKRGGNDWIGIVANERGGSGHGWPYSKWEVVNSKSSEDLYKILGMEAN